MKTILINSRCRVILFAMFGIALFLSGCSKSEVFTPENEIVNQNTLKAATNSFANANAVFDGFCRAYLIRGSNTFLSHSISDRGSEYFWGQGFCITSIIDAYERNPTADRKQIVSDLLNSFLNRETTNWTWNDWDDDIAWCLIPLSRGYLVTNNTRFLDAATLNWDYVYNRGWSGDVGGGIWERMDKDSKCALSNSPMVISGCYLYQGTGDVNYLNKSKAIYAWMRSHILNTSDWHVNEGVKSTGALMTSDNPWNQGSFINAATALYGLTGDVSYLNDAKNVANHVINKWPIMSAEADACARGIARLARENNLGGIYYPWLTNNCVAAWNKRRTDFNITNNNWTAQTGTADLVIMEAVSSLTIQSVTPEQGGPGIANGTYKIVSRQNGLVLDATGNGTANNTAIDVWGYNGANNQRWTVTNIGNGLYKIIGVGSGRSLNVSGASKNDLASVILYDYQNSSNENVYLYSPVSGYFSIFFSHSNKVMDVNASTGAVTQYFYNGGNNQQWQFIAL